MKVTGKIREFMPVVQGVSPREEWTSREVVVDYNLSTVRPRTVALRFSGERLNDLEAFTPGDTVEILFSVDASKNDEGKWFNHLNAFRITKL